MVKTEFTEMLRSSLTGGRMDKELDKIMLVMKQRYGKNIDIYDQDFLLKTLEKRKMTAGAENAAEYCRILETNSKEAEDFYRSLNIQYSQFFRDQLAFTLLEQAVFPGIINRKQSGHEIRIWSAGCSHGQEPYSIAMLLSELAEANREEIRFRIFATDISREAIAIGQAGVYNQDAVQNVKMFYLDKYFTKRDKTYTIVPCLRKNISFLTYNILDKSTFNPPESIYGGFDIVMCCNLLLYYKTELQQFIVNKLLKTILPGGYLVTDEAERAYIAKELKLKNIAIPISIFEKI